MLSSSSSPPPPPVLDNSLERTMDDSNMQKYKMLKRKLREMMEVFNSCTHSEKGSCVSLIDLCTKLNENISQEYAKAQKKVRLLTLERRYLIILWSDTID